MRTTLQRQLIQLAAVADNHEYDEAANFLMRNAMSEGVQNLEHDRLRELIAYIYRGISNFSGESQRNLIPAVKAYRILTGAGLKESKEWVETNVCPERLQGR